MVSQMTEDTFSRLSAVLPRNTDPHQQPRLLSLPISKATAVGTYVNVLPLGMNVGVFFSRSDRIRMNPIAGFRIRVPT